MEETLQRCLMQQMDPFMSFATVNHVHKCGHVDYMQNQLKNCEHSGQQ